MVRLTYGTYFSAKFYYVWHLSILFFNERSGHRSTMPGYCIRSLAFFDSWFWVDVNQRCFVCAQAAFWLAGRQANCQLFTATYFHLLITLVEEAVQLEIICMDRNIGNY